ncbi:MAG: RNA polymerase sigma-70 factor [Bacteroidota bacterium]
MENEHKIVEQLINKDRSAFSLVFNEYHGAMVLYALRFMDTREEAEEIAQEVFVKFWEKCHTLAADSSIKSYLYRSIHNLCLNAIKHQKVKDSYRQYVIQYMEQANTAFSENEDPDEIRTRIMGEIDNLPPRCSEIFKLSRFEGLKYQEIADHLGISIKTVEVQMGKALKTLRDKLGDLKNRLGAV